MQTTFSDDKATNGIDAAKPVKKLSDYIGQQVTVQNEAHEVGLNGAFQFCVNGILEEPDDDDGLFYVRVKECYNGTSGIHFSEKHLSRVDGVYQQPSGRIQITLRIA